MGGIELVDITKYFPENGVTADSSVDLIIEEGEIHAIVGENGSGKSTLMHILSGLVRPDRGKILLDNREVRINSPHGALKYGIGMVHQHVQIVREYTVLQNIILGREPRTWWGHIKLTEARQQVEALKKRYKLNIDLDRPSFELSIDGEQKTGLLALLYAGVKYIIIDEPATLFEESESDLLHTVLGELQKNGYTLIIITHKLREALHYADRVSVMRGGRRIITRPSRELSQEELSKLMVGPNTVIPASFGTDTSADTIHQQKTPKAHFKQAAEPILQVKNVGYAPHSGHSALPKIREVSFEVFPGEVLAVTGIRENGLETLEQLMSGFENPGTGDILYKGKSISGLSIRELRARGFAYIPTERMLRGASLDSSVAENMILLNYKDFHSWGRLKKEEIDHFTGNLKQLFNIKASTKDRLAGLSGGNIQKVIISREIINSPELLIFSEPSWGLDLRGRKFVMQKIDDLKSQGSAVLVITSDIEEALESADRIVVMYRGKVNGIVSADRVDKAEIGRLMLGVGPYA